MSSRKIGKILSALVAVVGLGTYGSGDCASSDLLHRWSFTGNYDDSVGGITAVGTGSVSWNNADNPTEIKLAGGNNGVSYVNLGKNIVPSTSSPVTIEIWATQHSIKNWSRIFDFGSDNKNYLLMTWSQGTDGNADRVELDKGGTAIMKADNTMRPYTLNTKYHISMTMTPSGGKTAFTWAKRDITTGAVLCSGSATSSQAWDPSTIASTPNNYLGRSEYSGDNDANASYDEVRIWKSALTAEQLRWSAQLGPDVLPVVDVTSAINHTLTITNENGTVSVNGVAGTGAVTIPCASDVRLVATPAEGYTFCRWEIDEQYLTSGSLTSAEITINLPRDVGVKAVFDEAVVKYARYANGAFSYLSAGKGPVEAPAGGMNSNVTIVFSSDAEYQALKTVPEEVAKAKGLELEANIKLTADTDWTALDYSLAGNAIDINGKHFTTGSLSGNGGIESDGNNVANAGFEANSIANGAYVVMTPNGWKTGGTVALIKNHSSYGGSQCNGSNWCMIWNGGYIYREFTVVQSGDYHFQFDVASRNSSSWWNSGVYAGFDNNNVINERTNTWNTRTKAFTVNLGVGTHTLKIGCNANSAILVDNVQLYKTSNSATSGILEVKVPEGKTVTNDTVALGGGQALQLWKTGKGTLVMNKTNTGYGSPFGYVANVVKEGVMAKSTTAGNASCGPQYASIQVDDGGTFDLKGRTYWDYQYILNGHGHDGKGALINTVSAGSPWASGNYGYMRNVELGSDTTISGTQYFGMSFWQHGATTMTMNNHTVHYGGTIIYFGNMSYAGKGRIVIDQGCTMESYISSPTATECTVEVSGQLQLHDKALGTVSNLIFTATGLFCNAWDSRPVYTVRDVYAPNIKTASNSKTKHPNLTLGTADSLYTHLDLSLFTDAFDASTTTFYTGSSVTVEFGSRALTDNQKVVSWSAIPNVSEFVGNGKNFGDFRLQAREDGLYAITAPTYATWDLVNECWQFFSSSGEPYTAEWTAGITDKIDVHFSSIEEFNAIKELGVTPAKYVMTGLPLASGTETLDFTTGFDFVIKPGLVLNLSSHRVKLPNSVLNGTVPFTVTDTTSAAVPPAIMANACFWLDALDKSTMNIDAEGKVQKWTSKDKNKVVATAPTGLAPTYKETGYSVPTLDFGAVGSGLDMGYTRFANLRTVFWVMQIATHEGAFFLGDTTNYNFHRGASGQYGNGSYHKYASMWKGTTAVNITADTPPNNQFCVYSATMSVNANSDRLTADRACSSSGVTRTGGRQLSELICFNTTLSDADRRAVIDYLQRKWIDVKDSGKLVVDVPAGASHTDGNYTVTGLAGLVKTGAGTLTLNKSGQSYTGGTRVEGGVVTMGNNSCFGKTGSEITVAANGTLELNGKYDLSGYNFVLAGGTLQNTAADIDNAKAQISNVRLTADSTFKLSCSYGFIGPGYAATKLDLAGHTLTVPVGVAKSFWFYNTTVTEGTIDIISGGWLRVDKTAVSAGNTTFRINCALDVAVPFTVGNYEVVYPADYNVGTGVMTVTGVFKPGTKYYRGVTLADGATLDLSGYSGAWTAKSGFSSGSNVATYPAGTAETSATLQVELQGRRLVPGEKIVGWDSGATPANLTFLPTESTRRAGRRLVVRDDGLYVSWCTQVWIR